MSNTEPTSARTMCPMNCHPTLCGMRVELNDGRLLGVSGDPDNPDSRGFLCVRGRAAGEIIDNPGRLLYPQLRERRDRGTDRWRRATWDEALALIAERVQALPPEAFALWSGHGDGATSYGTRLGGQLMRRFAHLHGSQWWHPSMICWGLGGFGLGLTGVLNVHTMDDMAANSELIVLWGANLASQPNTAPRLKVAKRRGARVVVIDVRQTEAAAQADEVLLIRPGSDTALALAMMQVIVAESHYDQAFIEHHTVGFAELKAHLKTYTPQWAESRTGIQAERIVQFARSYASTRPAMILLGGSSLHKSDNQWTAARAIACLPALTGQLGIPGGGMGPRHGASAHGQGLADIMPSCERRGGEAVIPNQMAAITRSLQQDQVRALLLVGTNMLSSFADSSSLAAGLKRAELVVCHDLFFNDTIRECADVVLPATAWLEQLGCKMTNTHVYLMDQLLAPAGEARSLGALLRALAAVLKVDDFFPWDSDEGPIDALLKHPATDYATVAALRAEGGMRALQTTPVAYPDHGYDTPSGKVEFFSERAQAFGLPPLPECPPVAVDSYPLVFCQGRTLTHFHSFYDQGRALPSLAKLDPSPLLWLAPADAATRQLEDGAPIKIFNDRGEMRAHARVTEKIPAGVVWMRDGWAGINRLTSGAAVVPDQALQAFPFSVGQAAYQARVEVAAATATV